MSDDAKTAFTNALNAGQEVPVTVPDPISQRLAGMFTSQNIQSNPNPPLLPGNVQDGTPKPKALSDSDARRWIYDNVRYVDTNGSRIILRTPVFLEPDDLLFKRLSSVFGQDVVLIKDEHTYWQERDEDKIPLPAVMSQEERIEDAAQQRLRYEVDDYRIEQRYQELRKEAIKQGDLPKESTKKAEDK